MSSPLPTAIVVLGLGGLVGMAFVAPASPLSAWLATMALLAALTLALGRRLTGSWRGALIDPRNRLSLSRLQMLAWTIPIVSAVYAAMLANVGRGQADPLRVDIPQALWVLMALSTTSLAAAPLIRGTKEARPANADQRVRTLETLAARRGDPTRQTLDTVGQEVVNVRAADASWADLVAGEEVGNAAFLDLGKVQLVYVSLILLLTYAAALGSMFQADPARFAGLPGLDNGLVALFGISHAGYLTGKALPQSRPPE